MKKINFFLLLFIFLISFNNQSYSMNNRCYEFIDGLRNLKYDQSSVYKQDSTFSGFGFDLHYDPTPGANLISDNFDSKLRRNKNNYPIISILESRVALDNFKNDDILISINDFDMSKLDDEEIRSLITTEDLEQFSEIIIEREEKKLKKKIKAHEYIKEYRTFYLVLNSINEINIKNSTIKFSAFLGSDREYSEHVGWAIVEHAKNTIVYFDEEAKENRSINCPEIPYDYAKENRIPFSGETFGFKDLISEDKDKVFETIGVNTFNETSTDDENDILLNISYYTEGIFEIKNKFNLTSFPFDRQKIIISMVDSDDFDEVLLVPVDTNYKMIDHNKKNLKIPGWNIIDVKFNMGNNLDFNGLVLSQASIELDIERQSFYYIFKIILPIILILIICWSSVWLDPKEVESKLTISIVCLLSLIAYNFVIDNELPKLEYLTIMDWIILLSYLFAAAPNMLAIISFQIDKKVKYKKLKSSIDTMSKRYGIISYILLIFMIVIINVTSVPDNTINALNWAAMK